MDLPDIPAALPIWLEYVRAIGTPFAAIVAASVAGFYARQHAQTAKDKLKLDLFTDRLEVFRGTIAVCSKNAMHEDGVLTSAEIENFYSAYFKAKFLFEGEMLTFLGEVNETIRGFAYIDEQIAKTNARVVAWGDDEGRARREADVFIT